VLLTDHAGVTWLLLPLAGAVVWLASRQRRWTMYQLSLALAFAVLVGVLTDIGADANHLVDVSALTVLVVGRFGAREIADAAVAAAARALLVFILIWAVVTQLAVVVGPDLVSARPDDPRFHSKPLAGVAAPSTSLLSEDPYVPLSLGQLPVILDPFMLLRIEHNDPARVDELVERIHAQKFDLVVLVRPLDPVEGEWWREFHFGPRIVSALATSYVFDRQLSGYHLYVPAGHPE
jgi:hypothetical protein